jgi:WD40 repeat protein
MTVEAPPRPPRADDPELVALIEALIEEARRRARRRRQRVAAAVLLVSVAGVSLLVGLAHSGGSAIRNGGGAGAASSASTLHQNGPLTVIAATHGKWGVFAVDATGLGKLLFRCWDGTHCGALESIAWSPDGRRLAYSSTYATPANGLHVVDLATGANVLVGRTDAVNRHWLDLSWSPDGTRLAFDSPERGVGTINADGSGQRAVPLPAGAADRSPSWSPDGTRIAYARATTTGEAVYTSAVDGSSRRLVTKHGALPAWSPDGKRIALLDGCTLRLYTPSGRDVTRGPSTGCSTWGTPLSAPVWSPDARKLAVMTTNGLWTLAADGTQLTHQHAGAWSLSGARQSWSRPAWRPKPRG